MKNYLIELFDKTSKKLEYLKDKDVAFSVPNISSHGDLATNVALTLTKELKRNPREIATEIVENLETDEKVIDKIEIAGPGFINFKFTKSYITHIINDVFEKKNAFGRTDKYKGKTALVEFVSANPTGPLTVGHGRNAVVGDTIANMLEWIGYDVDREYYFNNAGRQMRVLGESVKYRYLELCGEKVEMPESHYQGEYIIDIAKKIYDEFGDSLKNEDAEGKFKDVAEKEIFKEIEKTLENLNIKFDKFYNERELYDQGNIDEILDEFRKKDLIYEEEGATWFRLTELGQEQDKVIIKASGEPTYRLPDIAYHKTKFDRGYDMIIDLFGSDHIATYPDVMAGIKALGYDPELVKVVIYQFVTLMAKGEVVKMSTRKANFVTLDQLAEEVGSDVVRYFFNMRSVSSHLNFDIELAKTHSEENPVFYLQYAHARISSILKMTKEEKLSPSLENLDLLTTEEEQALIKKLHQFEEDMISASENFETHKVSNYLEELAGLFHKFYTQCRIIGSEHKLAEARIALCIATQWVIKNGLGILGVNAPDKM